MIIRESPARFTCHLSLLPSACLTIFMDNGVFQSAVVIGANALHEFSDGKGAHGFSHSPLAVYPLGFNRVQPGTLAR